MAAAQILLVLAFVVVPVADGRRNLQSALVKATALTFEGQNESSVVKANAPPLSACDKCNMKLKEIFATSVATITFSIVGLIATSAAPLTWGVVLPVVSSVTMGITIYAVSNTYLLKKSEEDDKALAALVVERHNETIQMIKAKNQQQQQEIGLLKEALINSHTRIDQLRDQLSHLIECSGFDSGQTLIAVGPRQDLQLFSRPPGPPPSPPHSDACIIDVNGCGCM